MKIYAASSWRNELQPSIVKQLRAAGHSCYDFRNPAPDEHGFSWSEIDPNWQRWTAAQFRDALKHPTAIRGLKLDFDGMNWADATVMVQPCGRSAALELGWAIGAGKRTIILLAESQEPELMFALADKICLTIEEVIAELTLPPVPRPAAVHSIDEVQRRARLALQPGTGELIMLLASARSAGQTIDQEAVAQALLWRNGELHSAKTALKIAEAVLAGDIPSPWVTPAEMKAAALVVIRNAIAHDPYATP